MTLGGEPLLYPDVVCAIHAAGRDCGIGSRTIITNAGSPRTAPEAQVLAGRLAESGVTGISISVDTFHQEHIPIQVVAQNVQAYADAGIPRLTWNPCWVVSADDDNPQNQDTRKVLDALAHLPVETGEGNVAQPDGNARVWLQPYLAPKVSAPAGSCEDVPYGARPDEIRCIGIEPDGGVSICRDWAIGNASRDDIVEVLRGYDPYEIPEARAVLEGGMTALEALCRSQEVGLDPEGYYSICDMCASLRAQLRHRVR